MSDFSRDVDGPGRRTRWQVVPIASRSRIGSAIVRFWRPLRRGEPHLIRICCAGCTRLALHDQGDRTLLLPHPRRNRLGLRPVSWPIGIPLGRPAQIELQGRDLHIGKQGYSGGGGDQISFQSNGYRYIVYDRTLRTSFGADGHIDPQSSSGLVVQKGGRTVSSTRCGGEGDQPVKTGEGERFTPTDGSVDH